MVCPKNVSMVTLTSFPTWFCPAMVTTPFLDLGTKPSDSGTWLQERPLDVSRIIQRLIDSYILAKKHLDITGCSRCQRLLWPVNVTWKVL